MLVLHQLLYVKYQLVARLVHDDGEGGMIKIFNDDSLTFIVDDCGGSPPAVECEVSVCCSSST